MLCVMLVDELGMLRNRLLERRSHITMNVLASLRLVVLAKASGSAALSKAATALDWTLAN